MRDTHFQTTGIKSCILFCIWSSIGHFQFPVLDQKTKSVHNWGEKSWQNESNLTFHPSSLLLLMTVIFIATTPAIFTSAKEVMWWLELSTKITIWISKYLRFPYHCRLNQISKCTWSKILKRLITLWPCVTSTHIQYNLVICAVKVEQPPLKEDDISPNALTQ